MLLALAHKLGLEPKKFSSTHGGEYHSPCPGCGGTDRFMIWNEKGRYWCRQCKKSGDAIQFCRDFMQMGFRQARDMAGSTSSIPVSVSRPSFIPHTAWIDKAQDFVASSHQRLLIDPIAIDVLKKRGLKLDTMHYFQLGWNPIDIYSERAAWGLTERLVDGKQKKLWLPQGIVIPALENTSCFKIKIRKAKWAEDDPFGKYYEVPGSSQKTPVFGDSDHGIAIIVEAELDAMLVLQEAGDLCCCVALGGAQKRPDPLTHHWLQEKKAILFALDFDDAGKAEYPYWRATYSNLIPWPVPMGKSPEEAFTKYGINIHAWIAEKLKQVV